MKILSKIYFNIFSSFTDTMKEYGCIIGGMNNIITMFEFDTGLHSDNSGCYIPNTKLLNQCIEKWYSKNISFYGIIHSHLTPYASLSNDDVKYIKKIMLSMPQNIDKLYFPIVLPKHTINSFKAIRKGNEISIVSDDIIIFN